MQQDLSRLRDENRLLRTPTIPQVVQAPRREAFTSTKVPRFDGTTSWEQYRQVFDAIVRSNGWDNDTAALQLFSHLEGDALNVAHLVPSVVNPEFLQLDDPLAVVFSPPLPSRSAVPATTEGPGPASGHLHPLRLPKVVGPLSPEVAPYRAVLGNSSLIVTQIHISVYI